MFLQGLEDVYIGGAQEDPEPYTHPTLSPTCIVFMQGLEDVYTGGAQEDRYARSVEMALTKKDEFGRTLTPKERFREQCYQ